MLTYQAKDWILGNKCHWRLRKDRVPYPLLLGKKFFLRRQVPGLLALANIFEIRRNPLLAPQNPAPIGKEGERELLTVGGGFGRNRVSTLERRELDIFLCKSRCCELSECGGMQKKTTCLSPFLNVFCLTLRNKRSRQVVIVYTRRVWHENIGLAAWGVGDGSSDRGGAAMRLALGS